MLLNCGVGEDSWESLGLQGDPTSPFRRRSALGFLWKEWCWSWNSSTLATSCEELTHWRGLWCWQGLGAGGEGDDRGSDGWMASLTWWTWVWVNSGSWWWTGRPGVLLFMGSQIVGYDWVTDLIWFNYYWSAVTLCDPMDCSPPHSSINGIFQAGVLEWVAISSSRRSSQPQGWTWVSCMVDRRFTIWITREVYLTIINCH